MSVQQAQHAAEQQQASADKLFQTILDDMKPYLAGTGREGSVAIADARKLVGLAVSCKGSAISFDQKVRAELGVAVGSKSFVPLQGKILQRVTDHANTANVQSSISTFKGGSRERVEGGITKGGLVRVAPSGDKPIFQKPAARTSMLGLQSLAEKKREADGITLPKRNRIAFEAQDEGGGEGDEAAGALTGAGKRQYRTKAPDTPSAGSGVDREAQERIQDRERERRGGGIQASSAGGHREGDTDNRDGGLDLRSDRRDRGERDRGGGRGGKDSERSSASTWETATPSGTPSHRSAAGSVQGTPQRSSVDQWDIVASGGRGEDRPRGGGRQEESQSRGGDRGGDKWREVKGGDRRGGALSKEQEAEMAEREKELDRDWYDNDEGGTFLDETGAYDPFESQGGDSGGINAPKAAQKKKMSAKKAAYMADDDRWIDNQLMNSGVVTASRAADNEDETEGRVHLMVRDIRPPFLDGKTVHTKKQDAVQTVRDPTGDLATIARKGCASVRAYREKRDLNKSRQKFWEIEGSKMGSLLGIKETEKAKEEGAPSVGEDGEVDYKKDNQFKNFMGEKNEAQSEFAKTKTLKQQRESLPIYGCREGMLRVVRDNQVVVIVGETGSGKTTQMAQYLHEEGYTTYGKIAITQPRRVAAMSVAKRVSEEWGCEMGQEVGYAIRFEDCTNESTLLKFMTDGILLRETLAETDLDQYSVVIMDEAHERSLNTDVLFGILRKVVSKRLDMKLIVTSATMDSNKFSEFFGGVPVFHIPGRTFPVEIMHSKNAVEDYVEATVKQCLQIHLSYPKGDVLAFMTGQEDIDAVCFLLRERLDELEDKAALCDILPIHSMLPSEIQAKIFKAVSSDTRKIVVATNIAETSLTIDGIKYVIDCGFYKLKVFNPRMGMDSLQVTPESQANARQRQGRAGRTGPGIAWRLFTEAAFNFEMLHNTIPEIQRTNLGNVVLLLKSLGVNDLLEFDFMDPPPQENILNSMYQLWILGALGNTGELTLQGRKMVEFPLDPPLSKMLIQAEDLKCNQEVLTIVASLSVGGLGHIFYRPKDRVEESDAAREKFAVPESDHLTMLHVYNQWKHNSFRADWAADHFLQAKSLHKVREIRTQLQDICSSQKMSLASCSADWDKVRQAVCSAYFTNAARMKGVGEYENLRTAMKCHLHPTSSLYGIGFTPDYVVYHELVMTSKEYMQCVSVVDPYWLAEQGPMFFQVKETSYQARMASKRKGEEAVKQMERDLERQRQQMVRDKEVEEAAALPRRAHTIATPGFRDQGSATPRRTPKRVGL